MIIICSPLFNSLSLSSPSDLAKCFWNRFTRAAPTRRVVVTRKYRSTNRSVAWKGHREGVVACRTWWMPCRLYRAMWPHEYAPQTRNTGISWCATAFGGMHRVAYLIKLEYAERYIHARWFCNIIADLSSHRFKLYSIYTSERLVFISSILSRLSNCKRKINVLLLI